LWLPLASGPWQPLYFHFAGNNGLGGEWIILEIFSMEGRKEQ
jgi:hypothetical protein